jgi:hypothetical protein
MSTMMFAVSLQMSCLNLFGQQSPAAQYWRSCAGEEKKSAMIDVSYAASQTVPDTDSETDSFQGDSIEVGFVYDGNVHKDVVRCC